MGRLLLLTVALLLAAAAPASAGLIDRAYRFDNVLDPHYPAGGPAAEPIGATSFEDGLGRKVLDADPGEGVRVERGATDAARWAVVLHLRLDDHGPVAQRILAPRAGDDGVYAQGGRLVVRHQGRTLSDDADLPPAGQWFQLVVEFGDVPGTLEVEELRVYVDGARRRALTVRDHRDTHRLGDHVQVFKDDGAEDGAGQLADLRLFSGALTPAVAQLGGPDDVQPPTIAAVDSMGVIAFTTFLTARPWLNMTGRDGERAASRAFARLRTTGGAPVAELTVRHHEQFSQTGQGVASAFLPEAAASLADGAQYDLIHGFVDYAGNVGAQTTRVTVDAVTPTGLSLDATPQRTPETAPLIAGRVNVAAGDDREVRIAIFRTQAPPGGSARAALTPARVAEETLTVPVGADGSFSVRPGKRYAAGDALRVEARHRDRAGNTQTADRVVVIARAEAGGLPPVPRGEQPVTRPRLASFLARLTDSVTRQVRRLGLRRLRRRGGVSLAVGSDRPGTLRVEVRRRGRRGALLARGSATFRKAGRARLRLRPTARGHRARGGAYTVRVTFR